MIMVRLNSIGYILSLNENIRDGILFGGVSICIWKYF